MMYIEIPSGTIYLNGYKVFRLKRKPYIQKGGENVPLTEEQKKLAREMTKAFAQLIDKMEDEQK